MFSGVVFLPVTFAVIEGRCPASMTAGTATSDQVWLSTKNVFQASVHLIPRMVKPRKLKKNLLHPKQPLDQSPNTNKK